MKTLVFSCSNFEKPFLETVAQEKNELVFTEKSLNQNTAYLSKGFDAVSLFILDDAMSDVLALLHSNGVQFITLRSVGHDNVDLAAAHKLGIKVANVPSYSPNSIAEHAVALLMALNRKILLGQKMMNENNFCLDGLVGFDLFGKTVGIIGTGKIGSAFANIMKGFGCKLLGYDILKNKELILQTGITYLTLNELCKNSDVISVHCPLTNATHHLFNKQLFNEMKKGVFFINTARGGIVNTVDLLDAIEKGIIGAAGLDVYENEKPLFFRDHLDSPIKDTVFEKLRLLPNVIITGHQAFLTNEALGGIAETTIKNLTDFSERRYSENNLN
jgi:D-lactate dehydrogenase